MNVTRRWLIIAISLFGAGCTGFVNVVAPKQGFDVVSSQPYATGSRRTLDIYRPSGASNNPVVVFFYGGSWQSGNKEDYAFVGSTLARLGYVTIIADYRVFPAVKYPDFLADAAAAVGWSKRNAEKFGGDPRSLFVAGHSAGAYIAAMLALDSRWLARERLDAKRDLAGWVGLSGPYDFLPLEDRTLQVIFGGANNASTQPISYVGRGHAPALLLTGDADTTVLPRNTLNLAARLQAQRNSVSVRTYPGVGHAQTVGAFSPAFSFLAPAVQDVDAFLRAHKRN
ncbi:alpha/beta hydrolase [Variibacter gotjawalensis]|nr:alpha/beta hydrolase [Variibacter gotjawalensis]NIK49847.1 acetyl esterase/lipase [Variibacter gotjawalensis]